MRIILSSFFAVFLLSSVLFAAPEPQLEKDFERTGQSASLIDSFQVYNGVTAPGLWSGLVEVIVSGFGVNVPSSGYLEDAFYPIDANAPEVPPVVQGGLVPVGLHIGFNGCSLSFECGAPRIETFLVYTDGVGFVDPPPATLEAFLEAIPYSEQHVYRFVIDLGVDPQELTVGHGDGGVFDNSGYFAIQLYAVEPAKKKGGRPE